jgi:hypothetical protein
MGQRQRNSVGSSLRGCIRDIVDGNHPIERVEYIVCSRAFASREELVAYVTAGRVSQKERMAEVAGRLWDNGKIVLPDAEGGRPEPCVLMLWHLVPQKPTVVPALF